MEITKVHLEETLERVNNLIEKNLINEACEEYIKCGEQIQNKDNTTDNLLKGEFYASFAYFLFQISEYEEAIRMFINAQEYGYSKDEIKSILFEAFIEPNLNEFKSIYDKNMEMLLSKGYISSSIDFENLPFWLIPTMVENQYYIYDKSESSIKKKITINFNDDNLKEAIVEDEFADFLIVENWDFTETKQYINFVKSNNKKSYIVIKEFSKFLSIFQGALLDDKTMADVIIFDGFENMEKYFKNNSEYLPRNLIDLTRNNKETKSILDEIHKYRISKEGRKGDNILVSICIPTYNRGNRAYDNVIHTLQSYYDEEIEIVVSNNGTKNETKEYYEKIKEIDDSRLIYFAFEENQGFAVNLCKVSELAKGKFIFILSDEDQIYLDVLHKGMKELYEGKDKLSMYRPRGTNQAKPPSNVLAKPGIEAMKIYMLTAYYVSGVVFNNELLRKHKVIEYVKENLNNSVCFYYPHVFWELVLCQYGYVKGSELTLINEGIGEETEVEKKEVGEKSKEIIPSYASFEGRMKQLEEFFQIFKELEISKEDFDIFREMYNQLAIKTLVLITVSIFTFYRKTDVNAKEMFEKSFNICIKYLDEMYSNKPKSYKKYYNEDLEKIKELYDNNRKYV